jgi:hypothetical protein
VHPHGHPLPRTGQGRVPYLGSGPRRRCHLPAGESIGGFARPIRQAGRRGRRCALRVAGRRWRRWHSGRTGRLRGRQRTVRGLRSGRCSRVRLRSSGRSTKAWETLRWGAPWHRLRDRQGQVAGEDRQPAMFLVDFRHVPVGARNAYGQVVAEPERRFVRSVEAHRHDRQVCPLRELPGNEPGGDIRCGPCSWRRSSLSGRRGTSGFGRECLWL